MCSNSDQFDNVSFEIFFKENFSSLCVFCQYKFHFDLDLAKETVHAAFIKLWENRETISNEKSLKAYLYTIVTNLAYDVLRHDKIKQRYEQDFLQNAATNPGKSDFNYAEFNQLRNDIDKAVAELPAQMRRIFEMSRNEGLKYSEISAVLSISVKTVETQMSRALVKLREKLSHYLITFYCFLILFTSSK